MKLTKNKALAVTIALCAAMLTACGNSSGNGNALKVDTVINPADNTNTPKMDSTLPQKAVGMDTAAGGKSRPPGAKDTSKHK